MPPVRFWLSLAVWAAYSAGLTVLFASNGWVFGSFLAFYPAALVFGFSAARPWVAAIPLLLGAVLAVVAYEVACPCYENGLGYFLWWWLAIYAIPSSWFAFLGAGISRYRARS